MSDTITKKRNIRNDILLVVALLLIALLGALYLFAFRSEGNSVKVTVDGKVYGVYSLSDNITEDIPTGDKQEHLNRLVIRDGKAYMESATCPDGICVSHKPIHRDGESIVCLPNKVVVTVITEDADGPDVVI